MSDYRIIGLQSIAIGDARTGATAGMPSTMTTVSAIVPDSCNLGLEVPGQTELGIEDSDYPDIVVNTPGAKIFEFATRDMGPVNMELGMGGTTSSTSWRAPNDAVVVKEVAIKAISKTYNGKKATIECVHCALRQGGNLRLSKSESGTLSFQANIMRPKHATTDAPIAVVWS